MKQMHFSCVSQNLEGYIELLRMSNKAQELGINEAL